MLRKIAFLCVLQVFLSTSAFAQDAPITNCDKYAASDVDPHRKTTGVPFDKVNAARLSLRVRLRCGNIKTILG